jgi:hypothetical protein
MKSRDEAIQVSTAVLLLHALHNVVHHVCWPVTTCRHCFWNIGITAGAKEGYDTHVAYGLLTDTCGADCALQAMATAFAERKVFLKQRQAELNAQARFLAGEGGAHSSNCNTSHEARFCSAPPVQPRQQS